MIIKSYLVDVTTLRHELVTDLDLRLHQVQVKRRSISSEQLGDTLTFLYSSK